LTVAGGIATNQVLTNHVWSWPWFGAAVLSVAAAGAADRRAVAQPRATLRSDLVDTKSQPLLVGQVTLRQLGVHPSPFASEGDSPYIERDVHKDEDRVSALREGDRGLLIVQGPRLAGTTRTLAEIARTSPLVSYRLLAYVNDPGVKISEMVAQGRRWAYTGPGAVLWLDDLTTAQLGQLDGALLDSLPPGMWILATVHDKRLKERRISEHVRRLLEERAVIITLGTLSAQEREATGAESAYATLQPALEAGDELLMGRLMVALDQIQSLLIPGSSEESADRVTLLRAVTDWYRISMPTLLTRQVLEKLYPAYRRELAGQRHGWPISLSGFENALTWVTAKSSRERPQLVDLQGSSRRNWYAPHPLLAVVAEDTGQPGAWPVADALWEYADGFLKGDQRRNIGYVALDREAFAQARRLLAHADKVDPRALHRVADWLRRTGDVSEARRWYRRLIATGHADQAPRAMVNLGIMEKQQRNLDEARRLWKQAITTGHADEAPRAMLGLGILENELGHVDEARRWWEQAIVTGHADIAPQVMVHLGVLEKQLGNLDEARRWYDKAIATGHTNQAPQAMVNLGNLENQQRNLNEARRWYDKAIATGHANEAPRAVASKIRCK
jgi:tetratricopeptide (TPR) repeat protein